MVEHSLSELLQPSLLDRLTDHSPDAKTEGRKDRVIDVRTLVDIVQRDLTWLLNTNNFETQFESDRYPNIQSSVLNYGIREVAGEMSTRDRAESIRKMIHDTIRRFEPRIRPGALSVELEEEDVAETTLISFTIRAEMWAQPIPLDLYLRSQVNLTTGELKLVRRG
jgi:type VI secretion system protein ImpF